MGRRASGSLLRLVACGGCTVGIFWLLGLLLTGLSGPVGLVGQARGCRTSVRRLSVAIQLYTQDHDERLPPSSGWLDRIQAYQKNAPGCPTVARTKPGAFGYALNSRVGGKLYANIPSPDTTPLVYDSSNLARNATDGFSSLPYPGRHSWRERRGSPLASGNLVAHVSGSVRFVADKREASGVRH